MFGAYTGVLLLVGFPVILVLIIAVVVTALYKRGVALPRGCGGRRDSASLQGGGGGGGAVGPPYPAFSTDEVSRILVHYVSSYRASEYQCDRLSIPLLVCTHWLDSQGSLVPSIASFSPLASLVARSVARMLALSFPD